MRSAPLIALLLVACADQGPGPTGKKIDPEFVREHLLVADQLGLDRLDDKLLYLGNRIDKPRPAPGDPITITHYWRVVKPVGADWRPFALVRAPAGSPDFMNLGATDMQVGHPPVTWTPGEVIEDPQTFVLRADWRAAKATVLVGLIQVGAHGTLDRMIAFGPHVQERAIVARELEVDLSRAPPPPGTVHIPRASGPITIDGAATEPGWATAAASKEFATAEGSPEPVGKATARMTWDDDNLYVAVSISDTDVVSPYKQQDDPLWKADCIELFIDGDGNRSGYVELQVSPFNITFDSYFPGPRGSKGDEAWDSGMVTAVATRAQGDKGWDVELAIPWAAAKGRSADMPLRIPPQVGDKWKLNIVRVDHRTGNDTTAASSWNRITYGDFHALDRMLTVVFASSDGTIVPRPAVPKPAPPPEQPPTAPSGGSAAPAARPAGSPPPAAGSAAPVPKQAGSSAKPAELAAPPAKK